MKHKAAVKGAAIAIAAMMTAGLGNGSVREAMASTQIPTKSVATVSSNKLKKSPKVTVSSRGTVSPAGEEKKDPENQALTPEAEKKEENRPSPAPERAEVSEEPAAEESPSVKEEKEKEQDAAVAEDGDGEEESAVSDQQSRPPIPEVKAEKDQEPRGKESLSVLSKERKRAVTDGISGVSDAEPKEEEVSQKPNSTERITESVSGPASETIQTTTSATPTEERKEADSDDENVTVSDKNTSRSSENPVKKEAEESEEESFSENQSVDQKTAAEESVQRTGGEEKATVNAEVTTPAKPAENAPIPEPSEEAESETALVGSAGDATQNVGASSGATQIVGDTTKRYETNVARTVVTSTPKRDTGVPNKGDLLAPKASNQSSSAGGRTASSSGNQKNHRSSNTSARNESYDGTSRKRIRTSTPQTGDHSGAILYAMMAGASLAAAVAAILTLRRER